VGLLKAPNWNVQYTGEGSYEQRFIWKGACGGYSITTNLTSYTRAKLGCDSRNINRLGGVTARVAGNTDQRRQLVGGSCLAAVTVMAVAYLTGAVGQQKPMLLSFAGLMLLGALRAWWVLPAPLQRQT
jgi:hypothetical protein